MSLKDAIQKKVRLSSALNKKAGMMPPGLTDALGTGAPLDASKVMKGPATQSELQRFANTRPLDASKVMKGPATQSELQRFADKPAADRGVSMQDRLKKMLGIRNRTKLTVTESNQKVYTPEEYAQSLKEKVK